MCLVPAIVLAIYAKENGKGAWGFQKSLVLLKRPLRATIKPKGRPKLALVASIHEPNEWNYALPTVSATKNWPARIAPLLTLPFVLTISGDLGVGKPPLAVGHIKGTRGI